MKKGKDVITEKTAAEVLAALKALEAREPVRVGRPGDEARAKLVSDMAPLVRALRGKGWSLSAIAREVATAAGISEKAARRLVTKAVTTKENDEVKPTKSPPRVTATPSRGSSLTAIDEA